MQAPGFFRGSSMKPPTKHAVFLSNPPVFIHPFHGSKWQHVARDGSGNMRAIMRSPSILELS